MKAELQPACDDLISKLRDRRLALRISQKCLDDLLGVAEGQVQKWERRRRTPSSFSLLVWAQGLRCETALVPLEMGEQRTT